MKMRRILGTWLYVCLLILSVANLYPAAVPSDDQSFQFETLSLPDLPELDIPSSSDTTSSDTSFDFSLLDLPPLPDISDLLGTAPTATPTVVAPVPSQASVAQPSGDATAQIPLPGFSELPTTPDSGLATTTSEDVDLDRLLGSEKEKSSGPKVDFKTYKGPSEHICGLLTKAMVLDKMSVAELLKMFLGFDISGIPAVGNYFKNAYIYDFTMGNEPVEHCTTAGYFGQQPAGGKAVYKPFQTGRMVTAISGRVRIEGREVQFKLRMDQSTLNENAFGMGLARMAIIIGLPDFGDGSGVKLSSISSAFKPLDSLKITKAAIAYCSGNQPFYDEEYGITFQPGANLLAEFVIDGSPMGSLIKKTGYKKPTITLQGVLEPSIVGSMFLVTVSGTLNLGALGHTQGSLTFAIYFEGLIPGVSFVPSIAFAIRAGFSIKLPGCSKPFSLFGEVKLNIVTTQLTLSMWMDGFIQFDKVDILKPFKIGNIIIAVGLNLQMAASTAGILAVNEVFFGGTIGIGDKELRVYAGLTIGPSFEIIIDVEFVGGLTIRDIVGLGLQLMHDVGLNVDVSLKDKVPKLGLKKFKGYICTTTRAYAGRMYQAGFELLIELEIFGVTAGVDFFVSPKEGELRVAGYLTKFKLGPFSVTGRGPDMKWNTPDDGPVIRLEVDVKKPPFLSLFVSGLIDIRVANFDILRAEIEIFLSAVGVAFMLDVSVLSIFEVFVLVNLLMIPVHDLLTTFGETMGKAAIAVAGKISPLLKEKMQLAVATNLREQLLKRLQSGKYFELPTSLPIPIGAKILPSLLDSQVKLASKFDDLLLKYADDIAKEGLEKTLVKRPDLASASQKLDDVGKKISDIRKQLDDLDVQIEKMKGQVKTSSQQAQQQTSSQAEALAKKAGIGVTQQQAQQAVDKAQNTISKINEQIAIYRAKNDTKKVQQLQDALGTAQQDLKNAQDRLARVKIQPSAYHEINALEELKNLFASATPSYAYEG